MFAAAALKEGEAYLRRRKVEEPRLCAEIILAHLLRVRRVDLYLYPEKDVSPRQKAVFESLLARRGQGEPLQYLTGEVVFRGLPFRVAKGVFIPRPETELLVQAAADRLAGIGRSGRVLEVGAGCGAIGLSLAKVSGIRILLIDKSPPAIEASRRNRRRLGLQNGRVEIRQANFRIFAEKTKRRFEMVVSNPPYIRLVDKKTLAREVRQEPEAALFGGPDGLDFIRFLVPGAHKLLAPGGYLIFEIGFGQKKKVISLVEKSGFHLEKVIKDFAGIDRVVIAKKLWKR